uniref:Uncharacterized protein n=1 Tax=Populus trichocarpa TaxID=3694 RepID=A0A2K2A223_POPTR
MLYSLEIFILTVKIITFGMTTQGRKEHNLNSGKILPTSHDCILQNRLLGNLCNTILAFLSYLAEAVSMLNGDIIDPLKASGHRGQIVLTAPGTT